MKLNDFLQSRNTNVMTMLILGVVLTAFFAYLLSQIIINSFFVGEDSTQRPSVVDTLTLPDQTVPLIRYDTGEAVTDLGTIILGQTEKSSEIIFTDAVSGRQLSGREIFQAYDIVFEPSLTSSIDVVTAGMIDGGLPAIIIKVSDFESSKGGLLAFEGTMVYDIYRMLGQRIEPGSPVLLARFFDEQIQDLDVRVVRDENDTVRLIWGFVDENTVIISPTRSAFERYVELVK